MIQSNDKLLQIDLGEKHSDLDDPDKNSNVDEDVPMCDTCEEDFDSIHPLWRILIKTDWMIISNCKTCLRVKQFLI